MTAVESAMLGSFYLKDYAPLLGFGATMRGIRNILEKVASTQATVLIRGETGVGKDVVARAIHAASARCDRPFVKVNCAALPPLLLESELFGHEKGAFTGAFRRRPGQFEYANHGTLFLDEIGALSADVQAKLLHVLQDWEFTRVGGLSTIHVDARVIAATNRRLEAAMCAGEFREDLYYRLNVVEIAVPPLRERREEIPALISLFLDRFNAQYSRTATLSPEEQALLEAYPWPGNIRELENVVRRLVVLSNRAKVYEALATRSREPARRTLRASSDLSDGLKVFTRRAVREAECQALQETLEAVQWNRAEAARRLKVSSKTVLKKISAFGLAPAQTR